MAERADRTPRRFRAASVIALVALSVTLFTGTALAAPSPTPAGLCGALNMSQAWGVGARGGMENAMSVDNANGNVGMFAAVGKTDCR